MEVGELPASWVRTSIGELCSRLQYGYTASSSTEPSGPRFLRITDIQNGQVSWPAVPYCQIDDQEFERYRLRSGDLVLARTGGTVGKSFLIVNLPEPAAFASYLIRLSPSKGVNPKYLYYFFQSTDYWEQIGIKKGGLQGNVNAQTLSSVELPLASLAEQGRIVTKIEELFSELDQGVASLKTAREQLKVYRQSLLKNAFEGKLTAEWRAAHRDQLETADALQQRIARERAERYRQQLADWEAQGKASPKPKAPKPLPPLTTEELTELPELPEGWRWVKLGELTWSVKDGPHFSPKYSESGIPFISGGNVRPEGVDFDKAKYISSELHKELCKRCKPERGDILYTKGGTTGIARVNTYDIDFNVWVHVAVLKLTGAVLPFYVQHALNSSFCYSQAQKYTHGVGNQDLGLTRMVHIVLATCSVAEQQEVVRIVDDEMSVIDQLDQTLATALQQAEALRQSILKKAFSGQLVPQDENDEPAAVLLERIRAARDGQKGKAKRAVLEALELKPSPGQVIPFPVALPGIAAKDLHAGILAMAYRLHEQNPERLQHFGHVKAEKISHLVEAHLGLDLERQPFKDAAGPNDHPHLKKVEHRARMANWFDVTRLESGKYVFHPKSGFDRLLEKTRRALGGRLGEVERLLDLMLPMTMRQAEILATVYAAWNNLLLQGETPTDEEIVTEARENWHESKLKIEREKFFTALDWMRGKGLVPTGRGRFVAAKGEV